MTLRFVLQYIPPAPALTWHVPAFDAEFKEENVKRDKGKFATQEGSGESKSDKPVKLTPVKEKDRAWTGTTKPTTRLTSQEAGALGEKIILSWLKSITGLKDAQPMNAHKSNFPVDLIGDHQLFEAKTGQVSNKPGSYDWRAKIGQPGIAETAALKKMSPEKKKAYNAKKKAKIMERKNAVIQEYSEKLGHKFSPKTIAVLLDPDRGVADIHQFDGFHHLVGYNSDLAKKGYVGSYKYK